MYVTKVLFFVKTRSICNVYRLINVVVVVVVVAVVVDCSCSELVLVSGPTLFNRYGKKRTRDVLFECLSNHTPKLFFEA